MHQCQSDALSREAVAETPVLTEGEIRDYHRDGYLIPNLRLTSARLEKLQQLTRQLISDNPHIKEGIGSPHLICGSSSQNVKTQEGWMDIATDPALIGLLQQLIGPDIILWASTLFHLPPQEGPATPWHRDGAFYPISPLATTTIWIAVFDSVRENGCLRLVPGSHRSRSLGRHARGRWGSDGKGLLSADEFDESAAADALLEPGQMVVFDVFTAHASWPNTGARPRAGFALRFCPATSYFDHDASDEEFRVAGGVRGRELILVSGTNRAGNRLGRVGRHLQVDGAMTR